MCSMSIATAGSSRTRTPMACAGTWSPRSTSARFRPALRPAERGGSPGEVVAGAVLPRHGFEEGGELEVACGDPVAGVVGAQARRHPRVRSGPFGMVVARLDAGDAGLQVGD